MDRLSFRSNADAAGFTILSNLVLLDTALSDGAKVTYLVLLHHARQAASCFPGQERLAAERGITERSVRSHLSELAARGLVTVERRGKARTNLYWIEGLEAVYRKETAGQSDDRKFSAAGDRKDSAAPEVRLEEHAFMQKESGTLNVSERGFDKSFLPEVRNLAGITGDTKSLRRFGQLYDIAMNAGQIDQWDEAVRSLRRRMAASEKMGPLRSPGAYFCKTLSELLLRQGVAVPVGSKAEREEIRTSLDIPGCEGK